MTWRQPPPDARPTFSVATHERDPRLTWQQRLARPMLRPCRRARSSYAAALIAGDAERFYVGSAAWLRLELVAAIGWPVASARFWRGLFALHTAHPGDVWVDLGRDLAGVVWRVDARGTWLLASTREAQLHGRAPEVLLVPRYRYVSWSPERRGWLA